MQYSLQPNSILTSLNKLSIIALWSLGSIFSISASYAQTYSASSNIDISNTILRPSTPSFVTNTVDVCPANTTVGSTTYTADTVGGNYYSVGDVLYLTDGSVIQLTSVGTGGTLISGGWNYINHGVNTTDPTSDLSIKYTISASTNANSSITNKGGSVFKDGCLYAKTSSAVYTPTEAALTSSPALATQLDTLDSGLISNPDGAWPAMGSILSNANSSGTTWRMSSASRLPYDWNNRSGGAGIPSIDVGSYNQVRILADNNFWGKLTPSSNPEWNGGIAWSDRLPESVLMEGFSPRWGDIKARNYTDSSLYDFSGQDPYKGPAPIESFSYVNHISPSAEITKQCSTVPKWTASYSYNIGDNIVVAIGDSSYIYMAVTAGKSGSTIPSFTGSETSNVSDGSIQWQLLRKSSVANTNVNNKNGWCNSDNLRGLDRGVVNWTTDTTNPQGTTVHKNTLYSNSFNGWGGFDINEYNTLMQTGTNWGWVQVNQLSEVGNIALGYYTNAADKSGWVGSGKMNYVEEWDMSGIGIEDPSTYYDPSAGNRIVLWFSDWENGGIKWSASLSVKAYTVLLVPDSSGQAWMYVAKNSGVTGATEPAFTFNETSPITDGGVTWVFQGKQRFQISRFMGVDKNHGGTGNFADIEYGTLFASSGVIYNAILDFSQTSFTSDVDDGIHALVRTPNGTMWDGSADGSRSGQNNNLFGYNNKWLFESKQSDGSFASSFSVFSGENGSFKGTTDALHYNLVPAGSSMNDATTIDTKITVFDTASNDGVGLRLPTSVSVPGTVTEIKNDTNKIVNLYPIDGGWGIAGTNSTGDPLELLPGMDTRLVYSGDYRNIIDTLNDNALSLYVLTDANISELTSWKYHSNGVVLFDSDKHTPIAYDARNGTWMSMTTIPYNASLSLSAIKAQTHSEGEKVWCHDCRAPGEATGAGTGRWIYLNSKSVWKTEDGLDASN